MLFYYLVKDRYVIKNNSYTEYVFSFGDQVITQDVGLKSTMTKQIILKICYSLFLQVAYFGSPIIAPAMIAQALEGSGQVRKTI